ncbi:hypothetical protein QYH69_06990 [Paraburkholderia sp. SARCC-3016]|uniref:hypothetical protein n=1 Tax=Paraburkholderia sp. SARCC-3016 TaxID=3058611 RepID=UPI0028066CD3|nr:hypothetical protein [Paraburkholderia sp. SARCC-3016]MDQ7976989.1 hypothetical protein [Paraburkholderia sp. SARCC-3016]
MTFDAPFLIVGTHVAFLCAPGPRGLSIAHPSAALQLLFPKSPAPRGADDTPRMPRDLDAAALAMAD